MKLYRFPENGIWKAAFWTMCLTMLLLARDTLFTSCLIGFYPAQLTVAGLVAALGIVLLAVNRKNIREILRDQRLLAFAVAAVMILAPMVFKADLQLMYLSVLLCIFFAVGLTYFVTMQEVARCYVVLMTILAAYSVFAVYIGRIPADRGMIDLPTFVNAGGREFYNFGLSFVSIREVRFRNFGIFREPGVYQFFLILALLLHNYILSWDKEWKFWLINGVLVVAAISTFSTNGVVAAGLLVLLVFFDKKLYKNKRILITAIALVTLAVAGAAVIMLRGGDMAFTLKQMVEKLYTLNRSSSARLHAVVADIGFFIRNPLFGEKIAVVLESVEHNTTSTMLMFAMFGILGGGLHLVSLVALTWDKDRKRWVNLSLTVIMLMSFNTQNMIADVFFWLFPIMALTETGLPLLNKARK